MRHRFFLLLIAWTVAAAGGVGLLTLRMAAAARDNVRRYHEQLADHAASTLEDFARELNSLAAVTADLQRIPASSPLTWSALQTAAATHPDLALLALQDEAGSEVARAADAGLFEGPTPTALWSEAMKRARSELEPSLGSVVELKGQAILPIAYPLKDRRVLLMGVRMTPLWERLASVRVGRSGRVAAADKEGRLLAGQGKGLPPALTFASEAPNGWLDFSSEGDWVGAYRTSKPLSWRVATLQPRSEAYGEARGFFMGALVLFGILAAGAAASAGWLSKQILLPLVDIMEGADRSSRNEFTTLVPARGWPELRALASSFNRMMVHLKAYQAMQIEKVLEEKSKVDALVQTIPEGIVMCDLEGNVIFANQPLDAIVGSGVHSKKRLQEVIIDPKVLGLAGSLMRREKRWGFCETVIAAAVPGQRGRWVKVLGAVISMAGGRDSGVLLLFRDITLEKELEQLKEEFFHSVIHDLRNPLTTLQMIIEMSGRAFQTEPKLQEYHRVAQRASGELQDLLTDVLDLAKLESGQYALTPEPTALIEVARRSAASLQFRAGSKKIAIECVEEGRLTPVPIEPQKIGRVISNLIGNAIKFTPPGGKIVVRVRQNPAETRISVEDTGPGIPSDKLTLVFEKFQQTDLGKQERSGFGLGLTICKRFVDLHGGRIWAESPPGQGAFFIFTIPLRHPVERAGQPKAS